MVRVGPVGGGAGGGRRRLPRAAAMAQSRDGQSLPAGI